MPNLMKAFDVKEEKVSVKPVKDYDIFKDKDPVLKKYNNF